MPGINKVSNVNSANGAIKTAEKAQEAAKTAAEKASSTNSASATVKSDTVQISDEAKKTNEASRTQTKMRSRRNSRSSRTDSHNRNDGAATADKAEKASRSNRAEKTHGTRRGQKVEQTGKQNSSVEKANLNDNRLGTKRTGKANNASALKKTTRELSMTFKGLKNTGVSSRDISKVIKTANRDMNKKLSVDLKQAYTDYKDKKISGDEFKSKLYEAAIKKVQGIASALTSNFTQKPAVGADNNGPTQVPRESILAKTADAQTTPAPAEKATAETTPLSMEEAKVASKGILADAKVAAENVLAPAREAAEAILAPAREAAEAILAPARETADKILATVEGKSDHQIAEANEKADLVLAKAKEEAEAILAPALKEAEAILAPARVEAKGILNDARESARGIVAEAREATATPPGLEEKEGFAPPGLEEKEGFAPPGLKENEGLSKLEKELKNLIDHIVKQAETLPPGLANDKGGPENAEKAFEKIVGMFNEVDKMVNDLDKEDSKKGFGDFVSGLKDMFSSGNGVKANSFLKDLHKVAHEHGGSDAHKVGMATIKAETLSGLLKGGSTNSAFGINRVGDNGEGSGNFTAVNFMSDLSGNASEGLDSYKDSKEARENAGVNGEEKTNADAEAEFSALV